MSETTTNSTPVEEAVNAEKSARDYNSDQLSVSICLASPEEFRKASFGEVKKPETINYRTFRPEKDGLFCERIFGPERDYECACGKYKGQKHFGITCDKCGVLVTTSRERRKRMGHITLAAPVVHIWFFSVTPSRIGNLLGMKKTELERVVYFQDYVVTDPGESDYKQCQLITEDEYRRARVQHGTSLVAKMGAEAVRDLLEGLNLESKAIELREGMKNCTSKQRLADIIKRLRTVEMLRDSPNDPSWMIMDVIPVIPPELRPLVRLDSGNFASSDLNDLYRRLINRNNRLLRLIELNAPEVIIRNEKRMLQQSVDALFDNGRCKRQVLSTSNQPLKSLTDMIKGKQGRFRLNLLGKRVDYSARSVIVVGPELKLHQCGLPKVIALELFQPFIIRRLKEQRLAETIKAAKKMLERREEVVWDILEKVITGHPVLLNRAPTLHRMGMQAFEPVLIEGNAIQLHPLMCPGYNADFDGDQMAVHVPLSVEAQMETRQLMLATNNIFSPASGRPVITPSQDIILGTYYLTWAKVRTPKEIEKQGHLPLFENTTEVEFAIANRKLDYHQYIRLRNPDHGKDSVFGDKESSIIETTPGRVRFNEIWPDGVGFFNNNVGKSQIGDIIWRCYQVAGGKATVQTMDQLKELGFKEATRSGCSIGIVDMVIPEEKPAELKTAYADVETVNKQYRNGVITNGERYQKVVDIWTRAGDNIANALYRKLEFNEGKEKANPLFMMVDSGARGNKNQIKQLSGMRGLMAKPSGEIIERPITSNFREGLSVLEYFISTHGARKGLADTALKTADSGYMTRKLVDVSQDVIITEPDCGTEKGITVHAIYSGDEEAASLQSRIYGRTSCETIKDPVSGDIIVKKGSLMDETTSIAVENVGHERLKIRSPLTCESERGCCQSCYGLNLATGKLGKIGEAVGIIAAQSIGEPGTQLTMRTFHSGGVALGATKQPEVKAKNKGVAYYKDLRTVEDVDGNFVVLNKNGSLSVRDKDGLELESYNVVIGSVISVADGGDVKKNQSILTWDPHSVPIIAESGGKIEFRDMITGITIQSETDKATGKKGLTVTEHKEDLHPQIVIVDPKSKDVLSSYSIPVGAHLSVKEGAKIQGGVQLARTPRKIAKTGDITGGLPRVAELFEARRPKDACVIAKLDGEISFGGTVRGKRKVIVTHTESGETADHLVPMGKHMIVGEGDMVVRGDQITEGPVAPEDLLEACGPQALQEHLNNEVQTVYRSQGVEINDKHIEIIIRQMLRKVKISEPGDTEFLWGDQIEKTTFNAENKRVAAEGGKPAEAEPVLLGITKASIETESFISAASFQDTTRVLTDAATLGKVDTLRGFKENVILGHLIPAGTGFPIHKNSDFEMTVEEPEPVVEKPEGEDGEALPEGEAPKVEAAGE